jgi:hypothetical protein
MILAKPYLTLDGCAKRCNFESAISKTHIYSPVRFIDGVRDAGQFDPTISKAKRYVWRVEKEKRRKA